MLMHLHKAHYKKESIMSMSVGIAAGVITLALVFYTIGVFKERSDGELRPIHLLFFGLGLASDVTGTSLMQQIAATSVGVATTHLVAGSLALVLMLVHVIWAIAVLVRDHPDAKARFHRFSNLVWLLWLVPYISGMLMGMPMGIGDGGATMIAAGIAALIAVVLWVRPQRTNGQLG